MAHTNLSVLAFLSSVAILSLIYRFSKWLFTYSFRFG